MKKVRMILTAAVVLAAVGTGLSFKARPKNPTNLWVLDASGRCNPGCSTAGTVSCPTQAYADAGCIIPTVGYLADQ